MIRGIGTSKGIGMGRALIVESPQMEISVKKIEDTAAEQERYKKAKAQFIEETQQMIEQLKQRLGEKDKTALILHNQIYLINDAEMDNGILQMIQEQKVCAEAAVEETCNLYIKIFENSGSEAVAQRIADIIDLKDRLAGILLGVHSVDLTHLPENTIIIAKELQPSITAVMDTAHVAGIVAEKGGETSHTAILARALEIPAVLSVEGVASSLKNGDTVVVDGSEGAVIVNPDDNTVAEYSKKRDAFLAERKELENYRGRETKSASGEVYELFCNIGKPEDAVKAVDADGEGVGLFRTEFLFMDRTSIPTEDEQFEAYKKAALILKGKSLIIRTLDIGGDKDIPYLGLEKEENPFMGFRAIRYCLKNRELFKSQIKAILRASAFGDIKIMFPLITTMDELREGKKLVAECKADLRNMDINFNENIQVGVMVETASAAVIADMLAKEADFFSIGTNDLTGYTMACDRGNNDVSYLYSPLQPSVLRMIKRTIECGVQNGISVGMCGEAAANKLMIPLLISFGLTEFSVSAPSVLNVRKIISTWTKEEADKVTAKVLEMSTQQEIVEYLKSVV